MHTTTRIVTSQCSILVTALLALHVAGVAHTTAASCLRFRALVCGVPQSAVLPVPPEASLTWCHLDEQPAVILASVLLSTSSPTRSHRCRTSTRKRRTKTSHHQDVLWGTGRSSLLLMNPRRLPKTQPILEKNSRLPLNWPDSLREDRVTAKLATSQHDPTALPTSSRRLPISHRSHAAEPQLHPTLGRHCSTSSLHHLKALQASIEHDHQPFSTCTLTRSMPDHSSTLLTNDLATALLSMYILTRLMTFPCLYSPLSTTVPRPLDKNSLARSNSLSLLPLFLVIIFSHWR